MVAVAIHDTPLVADGIGTCLKEHNHTYTGTIHGIEDAEQLFAEHDVNVVIIDPKANKETGMELVQWVQEHYPKCPIVLLVPKVSDELIDAAAHLQVAAVLDKGIHANDLARFVERVARGERLLSGEEVKSARARLERQGYATLANLGDVDKDIMAAIGNGYTDREIANIVYLSPQTVRNRVSRLLQRLGRENRTQLALMLRDYDDVFGRFRAG